ncbi:hypothetical protein HMPREF0262_01072 [Clostridium sp. ATCC 29733]|nr:hypothetical protein HMPREF0262_01072 [Clostridium sp. ATCC 29733]
MCILSSMTEGPHLFCLLYQCLSKRATAKRGCLEKDISRVHGVKIGSKHKKTGCPTREPGFERCQKVISKNYINLQKRDFSSSTLMSLGLPRQ